MQLGSQLDGGGGSDGNRGVDARAAVSRAVVAAGLSKAVVSSHWCGDGVVGPGPGQGTGGRPVVSFSMTCARASTEVLSGSVL